MLAIFVDSVLNTSNSYYVFLGLPNPGNAGFGRTTSESEWDSNTPVSTDKSPVFYTNTEILLYLVKKLTLPIFEE